MSNINKTAVQWLVDEIAEKYNFRFATYYGQEIQRALQMEKQQIVNARDGFPIHTRDCQDGEEYYELVYLKQNNEQ